MLGREMGGLAEQIGLVSGGRRFAWAIPEVWTWQQLGELGLMTQEILKEGDPDDQPRPTTHGVILRGRQSVFWVVGLADDAEPTESTVRDVVSVYDHAVASFE